MGILGDVLNSAKGAVRKTVNKARENHRHEQIISKAAKSRYEYQYKKEYDNERLHRAGRMAKKKARSDLSERFGDEPEDIKIGNIGIRPKKKKKKAQHIVYVRQPEPVPQGNKDGFGDPFEGAGYKW